MTDKATKTQTDSEDMGLIIPEQAAPAPLQMPSAAALELGFDQRMLAELQAEINRDFQALSVQEFTAPSSILKVPMNLNDAFPVQIVDKATKQLKDLIIYVCTRVDDTTGKVLFVTQSLNAIRQRWIDIYDKVRQTAALTGTNQGLTVTNVQFQILERAQGQAGNKPIACTLTPDSKLVPHS